MDSINTVAAIVASDSRSSSPTPVTPAKAPPEAATPLAVSAKKRAEKPPSSKKPPKKKTKLDDSVAETPLPVVTAESMPTAPPPGKSLSNEHLDIIDACVSLLNQTCSFERPSPLDEPPRFDCDEFTQNGIRQCVTFCLNVPGNRDLCIDDRAKLLKFGVYELAVSGRLTIHHPLTSGHTLDQWSSS